MIKYADMHSKGIMYLYQYQEGNDLDFGAYRFFEKRLNIFKIF